MLTALLSLGLGIGVNTAMFSLAVEFLLSEPSVRDAKSLVYVRQGGNSHVRPAVIDALRRSGVFEDVAGENEETFINFNNGRGDAAGLCRASHQELLHRARRSRGPRTRLE